MPALAFGLNSSKAGLPRPSQKRKAFFDDDNDASESLTTPPHGAKKTSKPLRPLQDLGDDEEDQGPPQNSPKVSQYGLQPAKPKAAAPPVGSDKYTNLSALRSAKLHDEEASKIDASIYDYDAAYETFNAQKERKKGDGAQGSGPKYMGSLLQSAEVRKRDQLRAREKLLQREREAEGDEFADKEKFVTGAYKKQQEENRKLEEEEKKREEAEEERRRKGGGMTAFHKRMLEKDEERMQLIKEAEEEVAKKKESGVRVEEQTEEEKSDTKIAEEMNQRGARVVVNDEGEVVDKRQLLSAGLNVAAKKPGKEQHTSTRPDAARAPEYWKSGKAQDARHAQRERQSRMMERQIEEMAEKQKQAEAEEEREQQEKNKSKVTEADKMSAKERFLQRKKEREEEARKKKEAGG
jgi:coiled-coil domain-containing protein 55